MSDSIKQKRPPKPPPPPPKSGQVISAKIDDQATEVKEEENRSTSSSPPPKPPRDLKERNVAPIEAAIKPFLQSSEAAPVAASSHSLEKESEAHSAKISSSSVKTFNFSNPMSKSNDQQSFNNNSSKTYLSVTSVVEDNLQISSEKQGDSRSVQTSKKRILGAPDVSNKIYHLVVFSEVWWIIFLLLHIGQFIILYSSAYEGLNTASLTVLVFLSVSVALLIVISRFFVKKSRLSLQRNIRIKGGSCSPEDEADIVSDTAVYCVTAACILEGISYAIYSAVLAGQKMHFAKPGYYSQGTILETLRFSSIVLLALHRIFRPANRVDPMRTILEMEIVTVCWDAIDGSTLYQLIESSGISVQYQLATKVLMAFWYCCVGLRMAIMLLTHLDPSAPLYGAVLMYPMQLAPQPTVDRSLQGIRLRGLVIMAMSIAEFFALGIRVSLWISGKLDSLQQEMTIKNIFFLAAFSGAFGMYQNSTERQWNSRDIMTFPFQIQYPSREFQLALCRWGFILSFVSISAIFSAILIQVSPDTIKWVGNVVVDFLLAVIFVTYYKNAHIKADHHEPVALFTAREKFFSFPGLQGSVLGALLVTSLLFARVPALFYSYGRLTNQQTEWGFNDGLLLISISIIPIGLYSTYWSLSYMLFRKEFTAAPGNYNAIHDPIIQMVSISTMTEGALDVLSCSTFIALAANDLPSEVNGFIVLFALLELANACQSFALQCILSGGHDDTPMDLVRWNGYFRLARVIIDAGAIFLRITLWVKYNAVSSVFLVKNLYNLLHTTSHVERWSGLSRYPKDTLFTEFVSPQDWYGLTKEEWRIATSETVIAQARSGRRV